jgi:uncharacterized membrane protein
VLLSIHVVTGAVALIFGAVALMAKKGGSVHRRSGLLFVCAMFVMAVSAAMLGNVGGGLMTIYFLATGLTTVRDVSPWTRAVTGVALAFATGFAFLTIVSGVKALDQPGLSAGGVPFRTIGIVSLLLAAIVAFAAVGDLRVVRSGLPRGRSRLARHLWRMCVALLIAAGSFFSIRERVAKILPESFTALPMRMLPIALVFGVMFFWLWKLRGRGNTMPQIVLRQEKENANLAS